MLKRLFLSLFAAAALLSAGLAPAQVSVDSAKTGVFRAATLLDASAAAVILPSSGSSNASGQITFTTALPATPVGTVGVFLPAGVVTAGTQGTGAGVYQATCSSTTVCTLTGTVTTANAAYTQTTSEVTLASLSVPGGAMGLSGALSVLAAYNVSNAATNKTLSVKYGGSNVRSGVVTTAGRTFSAVMRNRGAVNAQVSVQVLDGNTNTATLAIDSSVTQALTFTAQLAVATDFIILDEREAWQLP